MSQQSPLILVVEDDPDVSEGMVALLEEEGYRVGAARDGADGLRHLRENLGVKLILLDLTMPRMSAGEFRAVQRADPVMSEIPVLLMSANLDVSKQAQALGVAGYLGKPFRPAALIETIGRLVGPAATA